MKKTLCLILMLASLASCNTTKKISAPLAYNASKPYHGAKGQINQINTYVSSIVLDGDKVVERGASIPYETIFYNDLGQVREGLNFNTNGRPNYIWKSDYDENGILLRTESFSIPTGGPVNVELRISKTAEKIVWVNYTENKPHAIDTTTLYTNRMQRSDSLTMTSNPMKIVNYYDKNNNLVSMSQHFADNSALKQIHNYDAQGREVYSFTQYQNTTYTTQTEYTTIDGYGNWTEKIERSDKAPRIYTRKIIYKK